MKTKNLAPLFSIFYLFISACNLDGLRGVGSSAENNVPTSEEQQQEQVRICLEIPRPAGDFDHDGCVTDDDQKIFSANFGMTGASYSDGDANGNGTVDGGDYTVWADNFMTSCPVFGPSGLPGDANGDSKVTQADYVIWEGNFGNAVSGGANAGDFNNNGVADGGDYTIWADNYGKSEPCNP